MKTQAWLLQPSEQPQLEKVSQQKHIQSVMQGGVPCFCWAGTKVACNSCTTVSRLEAILEGIVDVQSVVKELSWQQVKLAG